jgi:hypothetical protein
MIITGAASGMGKAIAMLLAAEGGMAYGATAFHRRGCTLLLWMVSCATPTQGSKRPDIKKGNVQSLLEVWPNPMKLSVWCAICVRMGPAL